MEGFRQAIFELLLALFLIVVVASAVLYAPIVVLKRLMPVRGQPMGVLARISLATVLVMSVTACVATNGDGFDGVQVAHRSTTAT